MRGGVTAPQQRCRGAQPRCCGNRFQANWWLLAPCSDSLAHWRPPVPSLPFSLLLVWAGGGAGRGGGLGRRPGAGERSHPRGGAGLGIFFRLHSMPARSPPPPPRYSRAQASSSSWPLGSGRAAWAPWTELPALGRWRRPRGADCGSEGGSERWAGAAGRAHGRVHGASRAQRARARLSGEGLRPQPLAAEEAVPGAKGRGLAPICLPRLALHRECLRHATNLLATGCLGRAHAGGPGAHIGQAHGKLSQPGR